MGGAKEGRFGLCRAPGSAGSLAFPRYDVGRLLIRTGPAAIRDNDALIRRDVWSVARPCPASNSKLMLFRLERAKLREFMLDLRHDTAASVLPRELSALSIRNVLY